MTAFDPWDDPSATPPAFVPHTPEELAALDAALVEMKRDADAAFEELARNRDAADAQLVEMAREGAAALEAYLREQVANSSIPPLAGGQQKAVESPPGKPCLQE